MRGKYSVNNKKYIKNMIFQMTQHEKDKLKTKNFDELWCELWGIDEQSENIYKNEENSSKDKFYLLKKGLTNKNEFYNLDSIIDETIQTSWNEQEWGFPKGRRNYQEKDYDCAIREFCEETGLNKNVLHNIKNIYPFEEIFTGSNYKSYKHKYYVAYINIKDSNNLGSFQKTEVGKIEWKNYNDCMNLIRSYNLEKKRILTNINNTIKSFPLMHFNA
jgi:8-oxo-dGTP pyrophosphatase MutT (NUDIX family)